MVEPGRAAVFLDRDGVLNEVRMEGAVASTPRTVAELQILPTAKGDLARLRAAGYMLLVVSNQPDVARGDLSLDAVEEVNAVPDPPGPAGPIGPAGFAGPAGRGRRFGGGATHD